MRLYTCTAVTQPFLPLLLLRSISLGLEGCTHTAQKSLNLANYRPNAICAILSTIMEAFLELNAVISDRHHGFRRNRSIGELIAYLPEKWNQAIHAFGESGGI